MINPNTLTRMYTLHFAALPVVLIAFVTLHVYLEFCRRQGSRADHGLDLRTACWISRPVFRHDGQHGRRAFRYELGTGHRTVFFLSGMGALRNWAGGRRL